MILDLHEQIRVGVVFEGVWPRPVWFGFHGEKVTVTDVCYRWKERRGESTLYKFTLTDGHNLYEVSFSTADLIWRLNAIDEGGYDRVKHT